MRDWYSNHAASRANIESLHAGSLLDVRHRCRVHAGSATVGRDSHTGGLIGLCSFAIALGASAAPRAALASERIEDLLEGHLGASYIAFDGRGRLPSQWNVLLDMDLRYPLLSQLTGEHPYFVFRDGVIGRLAGSPLLHFQIDPAGGFAAGYEAQAGVHGQQWAWLLGARGDAAVWFIPPFQAIESASAVAVTSIEIVHSVRLDAWGSPFFGGSFGGELTVVVNPQRERDAAVGAFVRVARVPARAVTASADGDGELWYGIAGVRLFRFSTP
jgi:hypothetical protein